MLELAQRLRLDLSDTLTRARELLTTLFQRVVGSQDGTETQAQYARFTRHEGRQNARRALSQIALDGGLERNHRIAVWDEVAEMAVLLVADRRFEADRFLSD